MGSYNPAVFWDLLWYCFSFSVSYHFSLHWDILQDMVTLCLSNGLSVRTQTMVSSVKLVYPAAGGNSPGVQKTCKFCWDRVGAGFEHSAREL